MKKKNKSSSNNANPLSILIGMDSPSWFDKIEFARLKKNWDEYAAGYRNPNMFKKQIASMFDLNEEDVYLDNSPISGGSKVVRVELSAKVFLEKFKDESIFSTPDSGQDPKYDTTENIKIASQHAARHWGRIRYQSDWINGLTINVIRAGEYGEKVILEIVNGEHRLWGIIGFQLGLVPILSPDGKDLYFYSDKLIGTTSKDNINIHGRIPVNGLKLGQIVKKANDNLLNSANFVTEKDVLDCFQLNTIKVKFLPMYNRSQASFYFEEENTGSNKKLPQLFHARTEYPNIQIRKFSSIKDHNFNGTEDEMHPFYLECLSKKEWYKLMPHMISHLIVQYHRNNSFQNSKHRFVNSTDSAILDCYEKTKAYKDYYTDDGLAEGKTKNSLDYLHRLYSNASLPIEPSKQEMLILLETDAQFLGEKNQYIWDPGTFIDKFLQFKHDNYFLTPGDSKSGRTPFGTSMSHSSPEDYKRSWKFFRKNFLGDGKSEESMKSPEELLEMGIAAWGQELPRFFSKHRIKISAIENKQLDLDGKSFIDYGITPVGGHIISDWELNQLSDSERDEVAKLREGFKSEKFVFHENCRAMSAYHNNRMGVLPLSIYMEVINESDKVVRQRENQFREEVTSRLSKYRKAA
jgi:hypothetical protein